MEQIVGICFLAKDNHEYGQESEKLQLVVASNSMIYIIDQVER
jgi:hypothetical protein